jgi:N4-gp56 family major capsid protein
MAITVYGDISPRTAAYAAKEFLERAIPYLVLEKFGQAKPLPSNSSKTIIFRRYNALVATPNVISEGVTPSGKQLTSTDVTVTLEQLGDMVTITDIIMDTHEDPVFREAQDVLGEQAGQMVEIARFGVVKAGTNVYYANGTVRTDVNTPITLGLQRQITRYLKRQMAKKITTVIKSTPAYGTQSVAPSYIALCHSDCEADIRKMSGFVAVENYGGGMTPYESEIGKVEDVRYIYSTIFESWADGGGAKAGSGTTMLSTTGTNADVYPVLFLGRNAYGIVPLKGANAITPMVVNPKPSDSDPLAQRGHVSWKSMQKAIILNDAWMVRAEVAVTANPVA